MLRVANNASSAKQMEDLNKNSNFGLMNRKKSNEIDQRDGGGSRMGSMAGNLGANIMIKENPNMKSKKHSN